MKGSHFLLECVPKPRENGFGTRYLVKIAVAGTVNVFCTRIMTYLLNTTHAHHNINISG